MMFHIPLLLLLRQMFFHILVDHTAIFLLPLLNPLSLRALEYSFSSSFSIHFVQFWMFEWIHNGFLNFFFYHG